MFDCNLSRKKNHAAQLDRAWCLAYSRCPAILADNDVTGRKGETLTPVKGLTAYAGWNGVCAAAAVLGGLLTG